MPTLSGRSGRRFALLLGAGACAFALVLAILGAVLHPIPAISVENDDYAGFAADLLAGRLPTDPYRPLLYPLVVAAVGSFGANQDLHAATFAAGKLVSAFAAGLFVFWSGLLVRRIAGVRSAWLTVALLVTNAYVVRAGLLAATDALAAAFGAGVLLACVRSFDDGGSARSTRLLAVAFAAAYFTRYQAVLLLLPVALVLWQAGAPTARTRLRRGVEFVAWSALCLLPHFVLTWIAFGAPLYNELWRNVALRHYAGMDFGQLDTLPFDSLWSVLMHDPATVLRQGADELGRYVVRGLPELLAGDRIGRRALAIGLGWLLVLAVAVGGVAVIRRRDSRVAAIAYAYAAVHVAVICFTFLPLPRLMLLALPVALAAATTALIRVADRVRVAPRVALVVAVAPVLVVLTHASVRGVRQLERQHPFAEVAAVRWIMTGTPLTPRVLSTASTIGRVVGPNCSFAHAPHGAADFDDYLRRLAGHARAAGAEFVVVGRASIGARDWPRFATERDGLPLVRLWHDDDVCVFGRRDRVVDWIESACVEAKREGGAVRAAITLAADVSGGSVHGVAIVANGPDGQQHVVPLAGPADGVDPTWQADLEAARFAAGPWTFVPFVMATDGRFGLGAPIERSAAPD